MHERYGALILGRNNATFGQALSELATYIRTSNRSGAPLCTVGGADVAHAGADDEEGEPWMNVCTRPSHGDPATCCSSKVVFVSRHAMQVHWLWGYQATETEPEWCTKQNHRQEAPVLGLLSVESCKHCSRQTLGWRSPSPGMPRMQDCSSSRAPLPRLCCRSHHRCPPVQKTTIKNKRFFCAFQMFITRAANWDRLSCCAGIVQSQTCTGYESAYGPDKLPARFAACYIPLRT